MTTEVPYGMSNRFSRANVFSFVRHKLEMKFVVRGRSDQRVALNVRFGKKVHFNHFIACATTMVKLYRCQNLALN